MRRIDDDWWPGLLEFMATEDPLRDERVMIAGIDRPSGEHSYRHIYTALAHPDDVDELVSQIGFSGHDIQASGPHPTSQTGEYEPWFQVWAGPDTVLEPLVLAWESGVHTVMVLDPGFLMTYGLTPRLVGDVNQETHWDDPTGPEYDVAVVKAVSVYDFPNLSTASVRVARPYLEDYSTQRGHALLQVYHAEMWGVETDETVEFLGDEDNRTVYLPGRTVEVRRTTQHDRPVFAQVRGIRFLLGPGASPVIEGRWDYGDLCWPGIATPVSRERARHVDEHVYVSDEVLGAYEGRFGYRITPELGSVSYGNQWGVTHVGRFDRDRIAVDLRKLYEGAQPSVVRHYNEHAVDPPYEPWYTLHGVPNVATRSRRIVLELCQLGESVARVASAVLGRAVTGLEVVGLDRAVLEYEGWWTSTVVEPIAHHIPLSLTEDAFLERCLRLSRVVADGLGESLLRRTLLAMGVPDDVIMGHRSLRLLDRLIALSKSSLETGLSLRSHGRELQQRHVEAGSPRSIVILYAVQDLRNLAGHPTGTSGADRIGAALETVAVDPARAASGWGLVLDALYDAVADELAALTAAIADADAVLASSARDSTEAKG